MQIFQSREQALRQIATLMDRHGLALEDIANAMTIGDPDAPRRDTGHMAVSILSYVGGLLVFAGLGIYAHMGWGGFSSLQRVLITLGPGVIALVLALSCLRDARYLKAATPLLLISAVLQPAGILVFLHEYFSPSPHPEGAVAAVFLILSLQQAALFFRYRRTVMLLMTILFGFTGTGTLLYWLGADTAFCSVILAFVGLCLVRDIARRPLYCALAPWLYALFMLSMAGGLFALLSPFSLHWGYITVAAVLAGVAVLRSVTDFEDSHPFAVFFVVYCYQYFISCVFDRLGFPSGLDLFLAGGAGFAIAYGLSQTRQRQAVPPLYFVFCGMMTTGLLVLLQKTPFDPLLIGFGALMMYAGVILASRMLLAAAVLTLLAYLSYYTNHYFAHMVGWPLALVVLGVSLILLSAYAVRLGRTITKTP